MNELELAAVAVGPLDEPHEFELHMGYVLNESYIFILDRGMLWLRHVHKAPHMEYLYVDGETGGMLLAENMLGNAKELTELIVSRLHSMDALTFLTEVLLWTADRSDMNLKLERLL